MWNLMALQILHLLLFIVLTSDIRLDVTTDDKVDFKSSVLHRFCICLSISPKKPYSISMQADHHH